MVFINDKYKLADLMEKIINGKADKFDLFDARDLISELRIERGDIYFFSKSSLDKYYNKRKSIDEGKLIEDQERQVSLNF